jgi:hypothetical protein
MPFLFGGAFLDVAMAKGQPLFFEVPTLRLLSRLNLPHFFGSERNRLPVMQEKRKFFTLNFW